MVKLGHHQLFLFLLLAVSSVHVTGACQSCLVDLTVKGLLGSSTTKKSRHVNASINTLGGQKYAALPLALHRTPWSPAGLTRIDTSIFQFLLLRKIMSIAYEDKIVRIHEVKRVWAGGYFIEEMSNEKTDDDNNTIESTDPNDRDVREKVMSVSMIMAIGFYKQWISPLLPPACRFLPTCSQYGVQAINEFGSTRGVLLTVWRLARCTPLGGRGYDPPKWPPVSYTYSSY